jgi:hypothetical protein
MPQQTSFAGMPVAGSSRSNMDVPVAEAAPRMGPGVAIRRSPLRSAGQVASPPGVPTTEAAVQANAEAAAVATPSSTPAATQSAIEPTPITTVTTAPVGWSIEKKVAVGVGVAAGLGVIVGGIWMAKRAKLLP